MTKGRSRGRVPENMGREKIPRDPFLAKKPLAENNHKVHVILPHRDKTFTLKIKNATRKTGRHVANLGSEQRGQVSTGPSALPQLPQNDPHLFCSLPCMRGLQLALAGARLTFPHPRLYPAIPTIPCAILVRATGGPRRTEHMYYNTRRRWARRSDRHQQKKGGKNKRDFIVIFSFIKES